MGPGLELQDLPIDKCIESNNQPWEERPKETS